MKEILLVLGAASLFVGNFLSGRYLSKLWSRLVLFATAGPWAVLIAYAAFAVAYAIFMDQRTVDAVAGDNVPWYFMADVALAGFLMVGVPWIALCYFGYNEGAKRARRSTELRR